MPFNSTLPPAHKEGKEGRNGALFGIGESLYFCVPDNEKTLLKYWDTVADRLFKIRHCMDITGVVRPLALWDPPFDPLMLIKARAAGLDIGSIVSGLNQPVGPLRAMPLIQNLQWKQAQEATEAPSSLTPIPSGEAHLAFWGIGIHSKFAGEILGAVAKIGAELLQIKASLETDKAGIASRTASYERRTHEWLFQANVPHASDKTLLLSLRHDFPVKWAAFVGATGDLVIPIRAALFPYLTQGRQLPIDRLVLFAVRKDGELAQMTVDVPSELSDGVGGTSTPLTLHADGRVLARSANALVFLVIQYHLGSALHVSSGESRTQ